MEINRPINRRKALKVLGLGMLATCMPTLPACGNTKNEKKIKRLIFYFSATGNSLYVSRQIAGEEGTLLSISQEIHSDNPVYEAKEIGFVCPVYCFIPPAIVQDFIARSTFKADYFFTVGTFGAHSTIFPEFVDNLAKENGFQMNYINTIQMVDTYLPYFDAAREMADPKNQLIPEKIAAVLAAIDKRENYILPVTEMDRMICEGYYRSSGRDRKRLLHRRLRRMRRLHFCMPARFLEGSRRPFRRRRGVRKLPRLRPQLPAEGHLHHPDPSGAGGAEPECPLPQPERQHRRPDQGEQSDLISKIYEEEIVDGSRISPRRFSCGCPAVDDASSRSRQ